MANEHSQSGKGPFEAVVCANKRIGQWFYRLGVEFSGGGAEAFSQLRPGQFAQLDLSRVALPRKENIPEELGDAAQRNLLLRRPFSFYDINIKRDKTTVYILYRAVGPASLRMTALVEGNSLSVIGPLGNGYWVPEGKRKAVLVTGGIGTGPLEHLAKFLTENHSDMEVTAFAGAKTKEELPFEKPLDEVSQQLGFSLAEFARYGINSMVSTDDGSIGYEGLVTDCLAEWLGKNISSGKEAIIYGCGPEQMLVRVAEIARERQIDCQVSMERRMACGTGLCQSCAVECKVEGSNETVYKMCCVDGPVFDSKEIVFSE